MNTDMASALFSRFQIYLTKEDIDLCHHSGACDEDVYDVSQRGHVIEQLDGIDKEVLRAELKEYGEWNSVELADDAKNRRRVVWLAAADIQEEAE
jgi:hypothetical protein